MGDVEATLRRCNELIGQRVGELVRLSSVVESDPWGFVAEQRFLNQVLVVRTALSPAQLLNATQLIEHELGRIAKSHTKNGTPVYSSRTVDIDILFYDNQVVNTPSLTIPHPLLHERSFVLTPLCEIESDRIHPVLGESMDKLRIRLKNNVI